MPSQPIAHRGLLGAARRNPGKMSEALPNVAVVVKEVTGNWLPAGHLGSRAARHTWSEMRDLVLARAPSLSAPWPAAAGLCRVCRGPSGRSSAHCFQCELHVQCAPGSLADVVLPVVFAPKGSPIAQLLWQYKTNAHAEASTGQALLLALLLVFLRDHGACAWRSVGSGSPTHVAVVPTARGRPGEHPLRRLIAPYLRLPWARLSARPDQRERELDPLRFRAALVPDARVLLLDDTWTTGASAQSAAMALRRAGARSIATVVIARHIGIDPGFPVAAMPYRMESCAAHNDVGVAR
jgi:predicted amidophosphoribosyltransferase